jgi:thiamine-phosphate pyrophosphorylase
MDLGYKITRGVYLISPEKIENINEFAKDLKFILKRVFVPFFQLRLKNVENAEIVEAINVLKPICIKFNTNFVINDDAILGATYGADALHIGKFDGVINDVRRKFQGIIGVSCYNDLDRAFEMANSGANYVSFGAFFESKTKPNAIICEPSIIKRFKKKSSVAICVIGGLSATNSQALVKDGADLVALSHSIWSLNKNDERVKELSKINSFF